MSVSVVAPHCGYCKKMPPKGIKFQQCGGCEAVRYCDKTCQKEDWKTHKIICRFNSCIYRMKRNKRDNAKSKFFLEKLQNGVSKKSGGHLETQKEKIRALGDLQNCLKFTCKILNRNVASLKICEQAITDLARNDFKERKKN